MFIKLRISGMMVLFLIVNFFIQQLREFKINLAMVLPPKKECSAKKKEDVVNGIEPKCGVVVALHGYSLKFLFF